MLLKTDVNKLKFMGRRSQVVYGAAIERKNRKPNEPGSPHGISNLNNIVKLKYIASTLHVGPRASVPSTRQSLQHLVIVVLG